MPEIEPKPEFMVKEEPKVEDIVIVEEENSPIQEEVKEYKADILLAKNSPFETKLFQKVLDSIGYSYEVASNLSELESKVEEYDYKVILLDKELEELRLESFSKLIKTKSQESGLPSYIVLMNNNDEQKDDIVYVDEIIRNMVNKDLLRLVIEKFI